MKLLLMGCGGIGSWLCHFLAFGIRNHAINVDVTIADGDVVEPKNLLYSNFDVIDVGKNKAKVMAERYSFNCLKRNIKNKKELSDFDMVVVMTDDGKSRKLVYDSGVDYIDLRAKGRGYAAFANGAKNKKEMPKTLDLERERESCQHEERIARKSIDHGNIIAASIGYQMLLNYIRSELNVKEFRGYV